MAARSNESKPRLAGGVARRASTARRRRKVTRLPELLRPLFWEYRFGSLSWEQDRELVIAKVLQVGEFASWCWLRRKIGDRAMREWIISHRGRGISPRQLRYWELVVGVPSNAISEWLEDPGRAVWDQRVRQ